MGYIAHDAVIATIYGGDRAARRVEELRARLTPEFAALVIGPIQSAINDYSTYFLAPDGSKEGWDDSDYGDSVREQFAACFPSDVDVVTVRFGGDYRSEFEEPAGRVSQTGMTLDPSTLRALSRAAAHVREWTERRNELIRMAHTEGGSLREIARATGMNSGTIHTMLHGRKR